MKMYAMRKYLVVLSVTALALLLVVPSVGLAGLPDSAIMVFGSPDQGSGCSPIDPECNDQSFHAVDKIVPGAVSISKGGTVDFEVLGFHEVAIYESGIKPKDIEVDPAEFPFVNDTNGRLHLGPSLFPPSNPDTSFTFDQPGKYLVICNVAPHFEEAQMWAWVHVK